MYMANITQVYQFQYEYVYALIILKITTMYKTRLMKRFDS